MATAKLMAEFAKDDPFEVFLTDSDEIDAGKDTPQKEVVKSEDTLINRFWKGREMAGINTFTQLFFLPSSVFKIFCSLITFDEDPIINVYIGDRCSFIAEIIYILSLAIILSAYLMKNSIHKRGAKQRRRTKKK
tara:strand:- start:1479 stop:1880 length:402 start_codon:yes stop_codon:yes gene_type:complete